MCLDHPVAHGTDARPRRGGDRANPPMGGALPGGPSGRWPAALRHRPGRVRRRGATRLGAIHLPDFDFDGVAIGGLSVGEPVDTMLAMTAASVAELARRRAALLHGAGDRLRAARRDRARRGHVRLRGPDPPGAQRQRADTRRPPLAAQCGGPGRPAARSIPSARAPPAPASRAPTSATSSSRARSSPTGS